MDIIESLNSRFTCRAFNQNPVDRDIILKIIENATRSPSWANTQPWEIFVAGGEVLEKIRKAYMDNFSSDVPVDSDIPPVLDWPTELKERIKKLGIERYKHLGILKGDIEARNESWKLNFKFFGAPVVVYLCMHESLSEWSMFDMGSVSQSIMLAAQEYGIDSAPAINLVAYPKILRKEMVIPEDLSIVIGIALGYKDKQSTQNTLKTIRRPLNEVVRTKGI
jgi:nitroreductase